jgi:hypothetical protein
MAVRRGQSGRDAEFSINFRKALLAGNKLQFLA